MTLGKSQLLSVPPFLRGKVGRPRGDNSAGCIAHGKHSARAVLSHILQLFTVYQALRDTENCPHFKDMETEAQGVEMTSLKFEASYVCLASES